MPTRWDAAIRALEDALRRPGPMRAWLRSRRWCGEALTARTEVAVKDRATLWSSDDEALVLFLATAKEAQATVPMHLPFSLRTSPPDGEAFPLAVAGGTVHVIEAERREAYARFLTEEFRSHDAIPTEGKDTLRFSGTAGGVFLRMGPAAEGDSSNLLVRYGTDRAEVVFKSYKFPDVHNREPDVFARLAKKGFSHVPRYHGELALGRGETRLVLGIATEHVEATDAFAWLTAGWDAELRGEPVAPDFEARSLSLTASLGEATADLHEALFDRHPGPFQAETFTREDAEAAIKTALGYLSDALVRLAALARQGDRTSAARAATTRQMVFENRERIEAVLRGLAATVGTSKAITHADLHLAQVLQTEDGRLLFVDFEGEPERAPGQRHVKFPPLRDVATMNRSFAYVRDYAWRGFTRGDAASALRFLRRESFTPEESTVAERLAAWERAAVERYTQRYLARSRLYPEMDNAEAWRAIKGWMVEKALYELRYELKHRPPNVFIPLGGVMSLAAGSD